MSELAKGEHWEYETGYFAVMEDDVEAIEESYIDSFVSLGYEVFYGTCRAPFEGGERQAAWERIS